MEPDRSLGSDRANLLSDPAVDRGWRDRILHMPVGTLVLQADRRPHRASACGEADPAAPHRFECEIGLTKTRFGTLPALDRTHDNRAQRPSQLRLPHQVDVSELGLDSKVTIAVRAQFAEAAVHKAFFAVDGDEANLAGQLERVSCEQSE